MADYWKSQPKKFCQYCKCWIADNKPSIEFHERGKNHKQNVANKIEEIKKNSIAKAKKEEKMSKEFAAMEEAALRAYEEDMKRLQAESAGLEVSVASKVPVQAPKKVKKHKAKVKAKATTRPSSMKELNIWVMGATDDGQTYYYNTVTGESQWEKPEGFKGESVLPTEQTELYNTQESSSASVWMEAVSPDGYTYYYNTQTGESKWEKPHDMSPMEGSPVKKPEEHEGHSTPEPEPLSKGEDTNEAPKETANQDESKQSQGPKINFKKQKVEATPLLEKDDKKTKLDELDEKQEEKTQLDESDEEKKPDESSKAKEETKEEKPESSLPAEEKKPPAKKPRKMNPYGNWEQIQVEDDPYVSVDLQLPQTESVGGTSSELPPESKTKFKERTITSLGDESSEGATFKKRKTENGKSRSLRQRVKND